jgi:hypothetical protein
MFAGSFLGIKPHFLLQWQFVGVQRKKFSPFLTAKNKW